MSKWSNFDLRIDDLPPPRARKQSAKSASIGGDSKASKSSSSSAGGSERTKSGKGKPKSGPQRQSQSGSKSNPAAPAAAIERDPRASIRDDPFFRPYQTAQSARMAEKIRSDPTRAPDEQSKNTSIQQINFAVLGWQGVGKSSFIQKALDLRQPPQARASAKKMSLDSVIYLVRLIEMPLDEIGLPGKGRMTWPSFVDGQPTPPIDGVMILYDVTNRRSTLNFQNLLSVLAQTGQPCIIVSCKCDNPSQARQVETGAVEELGQSFGGIETYQTSANVPESQKRCISILLRAILAQSAAPQQSRPGRSRAESLSSLLPGSSSSHSKQSSRPGSEKSGKGKAKVAPSFHSGRASGRVSQDASPYPAGRGATSAPSDLDSLEPPGSPTSYLLDTALRPSTADSQAHQTFLNVDDDDQSEIVPDGMSVSNMSVSVQSMADIASVNISDREQSENGSTFEELVDDLLSLPMSKAEAKFVPIFLCLYRKFAAPNQLLAAILARFDFVERSGEPQLIRVSEQLRFLQVLSQWTNDYPGDFSHSKTKSEMMAFVTRLEKSRIFTYAAKEISNHLEHILEDDDNGWAFRDGGGEEDETSVESIQTESSTTLALAPSRSEGSLDDSMRDAAIESKEDLVETSSRHSAVPSLSSSLGPSFGGSTQSLATLMTYEEASREAQHLNPSPHRRLDKTVWRQFMALPGEEIARELTRMDWVMYSSIRPRDLVRHVSMSGDKKEKIRSLENVNRMINHFNHVALFVSSMILFRDKPKHRALALEKFMHIAWKLRQQNNYNSLGSVIAGINGTAIHRLAQTRELVPPQVQKEFMRLVILMGTGKSHFAYRLAWDNSFSEKIPFLPLHRRDLVAAEDGNRTFIGPKNDRINWKKFEIMGDVIIEIQRSQERPYPYMQRSDEIARLVLETKFLDGDEDSIDPYQELYERSVQLEPAGAADAKKSFGWLRGR